MKKFLFIFLLGVPFFFTGCGNSIYSIVKNNMAEITQEYFWAENENFSISLSVGKREDPYIIDGYAGKLTDFSLIIFTDKTRLIKNAEIDCQISINSQNKQIKLQYNPVADKFMYDLGFAIDGDADVNFLYQNQSIMLKNISSDFYTNCESALKISVEHCNSLLQSYKHKGKLHGECYLKIMGQKADAQLFWCFTFVTCDNKIFNVVIGIEDGEIVASDLKNCL